MPSDTSNNPFELVARALGCDVGKVTIDWGLNRNEYWDSFGHATVILALEGEYGEGIYKFVDGDKLELMDMRKIIEIHDTLKRGTNE